MIITEDFLKKETICGYTVTPKMKKIWAVELQMLEKFVDVCERHNLSYFMDGGTLLGAVRHKGFIPWDDDIDIIMPRKDYDRLWEIAPEEFQYPYFLQTTLSENGFFRTHAQLRNSETTGFIKIDGEKKVNCGIFMDIFVLDNIPDNVIEKRIFKYEIFIRKKILAYQYDRKYKGLSFKKKVFYKLVHTFFKVYPFKRFYKKFNRTLARYQNKKTSLVGDITLIWRPNVQWPREWYDGYCLLEFEGLKLRAPLFYKEVLARQYGNYMKLPKNVKAMNGRVHGNITFEPDVPYKVYFAQSGKVR